MMGESEGQWARGAMAMATVGTVDSGLKAGGEVGNCRAGAVAIQEAKSEPSPEAVPAVLVADPGTAGLRVVALTLLDRLVVAAHRAGCSPIWVVGREPLPPAGRAAALGIRWQVVPEMPRVAGDVVLADTRQLVMTGDIRRVLVGGGRLVTRDGVGLRVGRVSGAALGTVDPWSGAATVVAEGVAVPIGSAAEASAAGERLWASLTSGSDGMVDRHFNRPVGRLLLSRWLVHTPITPNQISVGATLLGVLAGVLFGVGGHAMTVWAAVLFQVSAVIDCVDGDVARSVFKESPLGKWLDIVGDQVVHASVFAGIAVGLWRQGGGMLELGLGASAVVGGLVAFGVILRGMQRPGGAGSRLQALIDGATNRDFSVLVLVLSVVDRLGWFLWAAAVGSHAFWLTALWLQRDGGKRGGPP